MDSYIINEIFRPFICQQYYSQLHETIQVNQAYAIMLAEEGLLAQEDKDLIYEGLSEVERELSEEELNVHKPDLYLTVMDKLYEKIGKEKGCLIHVGRSRNDMGCAVNRMYVRRTIREVLKLLSDVMEVMIRVAEKNTDTLITYYTYGQPAQPGTFGHYLMAGFDMLARDARRLMQAWKCTNISPLGSAAGMGTNYPINQERLAELLGFDKVIDNTIDAVSSPDYLLETESALAILMTGISRIAQDFVYWTSSENHILEFDLSCATGSSIMPQKKNPVILEHMRSRTAVAVGMLQTSLDLCRSTSMFPSIDGFNYLVSHYEQMLPEVLKPLYLLRVSLEHCQINKEKAMEHSRSNFIGATAISEYIAQHSDISFSDAHTIIRAKIIENKEVSLLLTEEEWKNIQTPEFALAYRVTKGSPVPEATKALIARNQKLLNEQREWLKIAERAER